jgi:hypothetical protein
MSDDFISSVVNGGSPQPVKEQAPTLTSNDADQLAHEANGDVQDISSEDDIAAAVQAGEISKKEAQVLRKKLVLKVDGEEIEEEVDWNDEDGLKKHLQKSKAFDKRSKEFSSYKTNVDAFLKRLQDDPESLLEEMGYDVDSMSEKRLSKKIEELKKSPEQLEKEKMQKELESLKKRIESEEKEKERLELEAKRNQHAMEIQEGIMKGLEDTKSKLPKDNPRVIEMIGQNMLFAMKNGYPNVTPKDVIPIVERQYRDEIRKFMDISPEDLIEEFVGKDNLARYRKKQLAASRSSVKTETPKQMIRDTGTSKPKEEVKEKKSFKKLFSYHD